MMLSRFNVNIPGNVSAKNYFWQATRSRSLYPESHLWLVCCLIDSQQQMLIRHGYKPKTALCIAPRT